MNVNATKKKLRAGETVFGCSIQQCGSTEIARIFAAAGFNYAFLDAEHSPFDFETLHALIRTCLDRGITPIVRVADLQYSLIARALDSGAQGIIFPRMESPELVARAIGWTRFPPEGVRGYGLSAPHLDYQQATFREVVQHMNENVLTVVQFETSAAIERCEELLSIPGMDVAMVGPADLSISLGVPGEFEHPKVVETITSLVDACRLHGVAPGIQCRTASLARKWTERGMRFVGCGSEHSLLFEKAKSTVADLSSVLKSVPTATGT